MDVAKKVSEEFGVVVTGKDVQNLKNIESAKKRQNLTATQCFFRELKNDSSCALRYELDELDRPIYVLFTFTSCLDIWRENPEVLMIDNTYKTNRFELPLLEVTGSTGLNTTFNAAWCLMKAEKMEDYQWVLSQLNAIMTAHDIDLPHFVITDYEKVLIGALNAVWPNVPTQLYVWHVQKNVQFNI